jgi:hypothetical protein
MHQARNVPYSAHVFTGSLLHRLDDPMSRRRDAGRGISVADDRSDARGHVENSKLEGQDRPQDLRVFHFRPFSGH